MQNSRIISIRFKLIIKLHVIGVRSIDRKFMMSMFGFKFELNQFLAPLFLQVLCSYSLVITWVKCFSKYFNDLCLIISERRKDLLLKTCAQQ